MQFNIHYDIAALLVCLALLFVFHYKKWIPSLQNKIYAAMLWSSLIAIICDIFDASLATYPDVFPQIFHVIVLYAYFISIDSLPILFALFAIVISGIQGNLFHGIRKYLFFGPLVLVILIIVLNPVLGWVFYPNVQGHFVRGFGVWILNGFAFYFMIYGVVEVVLMRRVLPKEKWVFLSVYPILAAIPVIFQTYRPTIYITMIGVVICLFLMYMTIQNHEEVVSQLGLLNRKAFLQSTSIIFQRNECFGVLGFSLKDYQYLKKLFGYAVVDEILKEVGERLKNHVSRDNLIYYMGNGRYALVYPLKKVYEQDVNVILQSFKNEIRTSHINVKVSLVVCIIKCPEDANNAETLMNNIIRFDQLMIANQTIVHMKDLGMIEDNRATDIENAMRRALVQGGFEVIYQPIYNTHSKKYGNAEALLRLSDPVLGVIMPNEFIPIAEKTGLIIPIGDYVFEEVCRFYSENQLKDKGISTIEINVSVVQCIQSNLAKKFTETVKKYNLSPSVIILEITESVASETPESIEELMTTLNYAGIYFALDDYGTGYSNLKSVIELPFRIVKIDKSMIDKMDNDRGIIAVKYTLDMLNALSLDIIAEGVETEAQALKLQELGCQYLQGYYYSKPIKAQAFLELLAEKA